LYWYDPYHCFLLTWVVRSWRAADLQPPVASRQAIPPGEFRSTPEPASSLTLGDRRPGPRHCQWQWLRRAQHTGREYGDISTNYPYDGGEYKIDLPFENLLFQKFRNTALQVGYCLTSAPDFKPYLPKPILLYYNGATTSSVKFYDGTTESTITNIALFGQDLFYNNQIYSLNFSTDTSTWYNVLIENSLFAVYYFGYLSNLFNIKNRLTKVKAYFPIGLTTSLRLNDRLVIQDKRYIINTINSDITTGEVSLELINDFRPVINLWYTK